ncbi:50S ribosomal protein L15 [Parvibaculum sp.]|jgi:large subunit ribosomal protein L15|uniref:50S ribosomal protein L15 n=1 Tax=Parvibaculum sp. TaxID=2024848 RepID=UPI001B1F8F84|nr:50S ribosomal protein L15 [Parvibaculum sp.]MBO6633869.1 50S ribosomal protein L15 [Parvibaculum sp.]MBO6680081.1 50S ribosomal protein L15 [Parvibaculum sp.]MBO6686496.1 50S ribosomal protein L15 [Parvibaculum sp.]MBO6904434.1 50S ribosomal protein L15 [Parvibaculum sp.]
MKLNEIRDNEGARKSRIRVGRGIGSGKGKTGGRGVKGQKSRTGVAIKGYEGGQMPIHMRLPKRGFKNPFRLDFNTVNVGRVQAAIDAGKLDKGAKVDAAALIAAGVIRRAKDGVRLLGNGELKAKLDFEVAGVSAGAKEAVEKAGGSVTVVEPKAKKAAAE